MNSNAQPEFHGLEPGTSVFVKRHPHEFLAVEAIVNESQTALIVLFDGIGNYVVRDECAGILLDLGFDVIDAR